MLASPPDWRDRPRMVIDARLADDMKVTRISYRDGR